MSPLSETDGLHDDRDAGDSPIRLIRPGVPPITFSPNRNCSCSATAASAAARKAFRSANCRHVGKKGLKSVVRMFAETGPCAAYRLFLHSVDAKAAFGGCTRRRCHLRNFAQHTSKTWSFTFEIIVLLRLRERFLPFVADRLSDSLSLMIVRDTDCQVQDPTLIWDAHYSLQYRVSGL